MVKTSKGRCIRVKLGSQCLDLKIVASHVYLGIKISFLKFEMETAQHRLQLARSVFSRLKTILCCQAVPQHSRLRLWQSCIPPSLLHGLDCTGITEVIAGKIRSLVTQQLRQIVRSYSMFTHEANEDLLLRLHVEDPIDRIYKAFTHRCSKPPMDFERLQVWESHTQWLSVLRGRLFDNSEAARQSAQDVRIGSAGQSSAKARAAPVNLVTEQFACQECGFAFATQAALKSHKCKSHFAEQDKETRQAEIHKHKQHPATEHARDGMPTCKHCGHQFETWPAFTYHVNSRNCAEIRFFYAQENSRDQLATLQDALTSRDELLQAATSLTWREMAELHVVKQHHNHCLECHHWCASPMYVKRHMKSKHPELTAIVQDVTAKIIQSNLALKSPCRFCGQTFKNRRARLSSCIGIFNGHYLLRRLGRKPVTGLQEAAKELAQATSELDMIRALTPTLQATPSAPATSTEAPAPVPDQAMDASDKSATRARTEDTGDKSKDRQAKWSRPASKGNQQGRGGKGQSQNSSKWENWSNWKDHDKDKSDLNQLKQHVDMLTTLVLRQEHQLMINRQDTSYIIFIRTDVTPSLAVTSFNIGQSWKRPKLRIRRA